MKKLIALVLILALPSFAFGAGAYSVVETGGTAAASIAPGTASLSLDIVLTVDEANIGFGGALEGPAGVTIVSRTMAAPVSAAEWLQNSTDAQLVGSSLSAKWDFGAVDTVSQSFGPGAVKLVTLVVNPSLLAPGVYQLRVGDSTNLPPSLGGATDNNTGWYAPASLFGLPVTADAGAAFTLTVTPEPVTMLLLAGALPFLRRRSA